MYNLLLTNEKDFPVQQTNKEHRHEPLTIETCGPSRPKVIQIRKERTPNT